jgi:hypothetical protein
MPTGTDPLDALFLREEAPAFLKGHGGYKVSQHSLATYATRGGGPTFRKFGSRPMYLGRDLISWAEAKLSAPRRTTSEADTRHAA